MGDGRAVFSLQYSVFSLQKSEGKEQRAKGQRAKGKGQSSPKDVKPRTTRNTRTEFQRTFSRIQRVSRLRILPFVCYCRARAQRHKSPATLAPGKSARILTDAATLARAAVVPWSICLTSDLRLLKTEH